MIKANNKKRKNSRQPSFSTRPLFPSTHRTTLTYIDDRSVDPGAGTLGTFVVKANGLYDPNTTGIGHQPSGFDQLALFYKKYCVLRSVAKVTFLPTGSDTVIATCGVTLSTSSTLSDLRATMEQPGSRYVYFKNNTSYGSPRSLTTVANISNYFGVNNPQDNSNLYASVTSDPGYVLNYVFWICSSDLTTDLSAVLTRVEVKYDVLFFDRTVLESS